jgi:hypothetical protein
MKYLNKIKWTVDSSLSKKEVELLDFQKVKTTVANTQLPTHE